jgi:hypothetical protein
LDTSCRMWTGQWVSVPPLATVAADLIEKETEVSHEVSGIWCTVIMTTIYLTRINRENWHKDPKAQRKIVW